MQIKVNMEIRDIENELAFGLTPRKLVTTILIFIVVVPLYTTLVRKITMDAAAVTAVLAGGIIGVAGFGKWHEMHMEQAVLYWLHTLLCPKQLVFRGVNVYDDEIQAVCKAKESAGKEITRVIQKDIDTSEAAAEGAASDTAPDAGSDPGQAGL